MSTKPVILIIDDMEVNRYTFGRLLGHAGYEIKEAATIATGMHILASGKIDLLILDVQLPDGNGFDTCANIKGDPMLAAIPILMTSASFVEARDKALGLDQGADGYLTTPIDALELIATAKSLLRIRVAEQKLKEVAEKAEAANNAKTEFLANMSHEIRTPMNAVIGLANILALTPLTKKQQEFISTLQQSAESLMRLINDLLDITKIEENKIELENIPFSMQSLIDRVSDMMASQARQKGIEIIHHIDSSVASFYSGDPQRLFQVLLNLVGNAIKFTSAGSVSIEVSTSSDITPDRHVLVIRVRDTGIGIPQTKLDMIFNKFTQADNSTTRKYGGSGLGLTIARRLIEAMDGTIAVDSEVDKGSVFTISVALKALDANESAPCIKFTSDNVAPLARGQGKILLVEDHPPNVLVATTLLESFGYHCILAINGVQALAILKEEPIDVVLMDIQMHAMDGYEATRSLRQWEKEHNKPRIPVIAMTAHSLSGDREKCLASGMDDYLSKPINAYELEKALLRFCAVTC